MQRRFQVYVWILIIGWMLPSCEIEIEEDFYGDERDQLVVCNEDDEDYQVKIHRAADGRVIAEFHVEEWYDIADKCNGADELPEGWYYLTIHEHGAVIPSDTSESFYIDSDDDEYFWIRSPGRIFRD